MELPVIERFCVSYDMRVGAITMGILNALMTMCLSIILIELAPICKALVEARLQGEDAATVKVVHTIVVMQVLLLIIKFLLDWACVYAAYKKKINLVKKYCIFWIVLMVIFIIGFLKTLFHMDALHIAVQVGFILANFYNIIIIRSYVVISNRDGVQ